MKDDMSCLNATLLLRIFRLVAEIPYKGEKENCI